MSPQSRRNFLYTSSTGLLGLGLLGPLACQEHSQEQDQASAQANAELFFKMSLAQWSLHRSFESNKLDPRDFASIARKNFDIGAIEYVASFYPDKARDAAYLKDLRQRGEDHDVRGLLIMIDDHGDLGSPDATARKAAVENHYQWVDAAKALGCHSIRVNGFGEGTREEVGKALTDGLSQLCTYASTMNINVLIENHGLYSSDGQWVAQVMEQVAMPNCGTLPDFGNFCVARKWGSTQDGTCPEVYDRYEGVEEMLPHAKGVSAKSYAFDAEGNETTIDYARMLKIVKESGFTGYVGIEYEGSELGEMEGIAATKRLLERVGEALT